MKQSSLQRAQDTLGTMLRELFGPDLRGINGFGAALDRFTKAPALKVAVDGPSSAKQAEKLPKVIEGLPVNVEQRRPVRGGAA